MAAPSATVLATVAVHSDFKSKTNVFSSRFGPHSMSPSWFSECGLAVDESGQLTVDYTSFLQSKSLRSLPAL